jgi:hypothetical protein
MVHKTIGQASANLVQSVSLIPERYRQGVQGADWKSKAGSDSAEANFKAEMSKVIAEGRRKKGVDATSNETWRAGAVAAADSIGAAITASKDKYEKNFAAILTAMNSAADQAKPRTTDAMVNIDNRLKPVVKAAMDAARR